MVKFYKYYKHDSTRQARAEERRWKKTLDSTWQANRFEQKLMRRLAKPGIAPKQVGLPDSIHREFGKWWIILKDSTSSDSLTIVAKEKLKALAVERVKQFPGFQDLMAKYQLGDSVRWQSLASKIPGLDSLQSIFNSSPEQIFELAEKQSMKYLERSEVFGKMGEQISQAEALKTLPDQYKLQAEQYTDSTYLAEQVKMKAMAELTERFAQQTEKIQGAQQKVSKLLSKYREFANSSDLSTATKQTSLEGKSFSERLVIGGNFNIVSTQPFSIDFSPQLGYKFNTQFFIGLGMSYRCTFGDSIKNSYYVSPSNTSFKVLANYTVIKSIYAHAEWERSGIQTKAGDESSKGWKDNYFVGVGKRFLVHPKVYLTLTALYNLNSEDENPIHPRRFQIRMGFQLSELATRKKKIYYDPNR